MTDAGLEQLVVQLTNEVRHRYYGKYRGIVERVEDEERMGRLTAKVPAVYGDVLESPWASPAVPFAGNGYGMLTLPRRGDGVWMEFEAGDPSRPIWTGCWWSRSGTPQPGGPDQRVLVTPQGLKIVLDDEGPTLQLLHAGGAEITMTSSDITLKMGSGKIVISSQGVSVNDGALEVR